MASKKTNGLLSKKSLLIGVLVAVVFVGAFAIFKDRSARTNTPASESTQEPTSKINLDPPTEEEINETQDHKGSLNDQDNKPTTGTDGRLKVTPIITSADQTTIRSYISGITEDGGTCTATFQQGSSTFTKQSSGIRDINTTICEPIRVERSNFATSGEWTVFISYESSDAIGKSQETTFKVNQ